MTTPAKFVGRLTVPAGVTVDIASTAVTAAVALVAGDYYVLDGHRATVNGAQGPTVTLTVESGHSIAVGDVITIWDESGAVALTTAATVNAITATTVKTDVSVTVQDDDQIWVTKDLLGMITGMIAATAGTPSDCVAMAITHDADGIVSIADTGIPNDDATITWDANSADVQDWLRMPASTVFGGTTTETGSRTHAFGFYPDASLVHDKPVKLAQRAVARANDGTTQTIHIATWRRHLVEVVYDGGTRESSWGEMHSFDDFWGRAVQGYELRFYPDTSITIPYVEKTTPRGYQSWTLVEPTTWEPRELIAGWYEYFTEALVLQQFTEA